MNEWGDMQVVLTTEGRSAQTTGLPAWILALGVFDGPEGGTPQVYCSCSPSEHTPHSQAVWSPRSLPQGAQLRSP